MRQKLFFLNGFPALSRRGEIKRKNRVMNGGLSHMEPTSKTTAITILVSFQQWRVCMYLCLCTCSCVLVCMCVCMEKGIKIWCHINIVVYVLHDNKIKCHLIHRLGLHLFLLILQNRHQYIEII